MSTHSTSASPHQAPATRARLGHDDASESHSSPSQILSLVATAALGVVFALAWTNGAQPSSADKLTLLVLALPGIAFFWTPLFRLFDHQETVPDAARVDAARIDAARIDAARIDDEQRGETRIENTRGDNQRREEASAFALSLAMFVVYGMARAAGPNDDAWSLHFAALPTTVFAVPWAARVVVLGALVTAPLWMRHLNGWTRAVLGALAIVALLGIASFSFLRGYYPVGETDAILDPKPLADTMMQVVEYGALALLCSAACAVPKTRRIVLRALPLLLLALWVRHQWFPAPPPPEDDE
jgi:hypothetical protein